MVAARIRTHILTTQPLEHECDALNRSPMVPPSAAKVSPTISS